MGENEGGGGGRGDSMEFAGRHSSANIQFQGCARFRLFSSLFPTPALGGSDQAIVGFGQLLDFSVKAAL